MNKNLVKVGSKFIFVGITSTLLNYGVFYFLYKVLAVNYIVASVAGYITGLILGFVLNNFWTFEFGRLDLRKVAGYLLVYMASLGLSSIMLYILVDWYGINPFASNIMAIILSTCTNFLGLTFLIYKK